MHRLAPLVGYCGALVLLALVCRELDIPFSAGLTTVSAVVAIPYMVVVIVRDHRVLVPEKGKTK